MNRDEIYAAVQRKLMELGAKPAAKGNRILAEAVYQHRQNTGLIHGQWCKQLLPEIGRGCGVSPESAEAHMRRTIRHLFNSDGKRVRSLLAMSSKAPEPMPREFVVILSGVI